MNAITTTTQRSSRFPLVFELMVWLIYVCLYKYSVFLDQGHLPNPRYEAFPWPQLIVYAIAMTLYTIPFYRYIAPRLLLAKRYISLMLAIILYFWIVLKLNNWLVTWIFQSLHTTGDLSVYYQGQHEIAAKKLRFLFGWDPNTLLTDLLAFMSVAFMRYAFENEKKKFLLEKDNLVLQLETLKSQLHPHFLFNTLNSIYGMSLIGDKEAPTQILRLSDMMRYVLYDCQHHFVPLEKDLAFIRNYVAMEKTRYPEADIDFNVKGNGNGQQVVPMLFIQFIENSFKHGAHRVTDKGYIHGSLELQEGRLHFHLVNDMLPDNLPYAAASMADPGPNRASYGGIGIQNVQKRLELFYPNRHKMTIKKEHGIYEVTVDILLSPVS
ncbi:MAG: sensor histidine kinase [Chitinophagaceae bacterium]|nr:sensor histidine kinase [Chitinophagaceae bacterium]